MIKSFRNNIISFTKSQKEIPVIAAIASGIYPLSYYYYSNFTLLNSWEQIIFFIFYFLIIPVITFKLIHYVIAKVSFLKFLRKYAITLMNFSWTGFLLVFISYGLRLKIIALVLLIAVVLGFLLYKHLKKVVVFQFLMALVAFCFLMKFILFDLVYPNEWMQQPDDIEQAILKKKPNIYFIQPDGYANNAELVKGYYNFDNSQFENYLTQNNFVQYSGFRSNYNSTLSSNSSLFAMKHHYYNFPKDKPREVFNSRDILAGNNPVIEILKSNDYKTFYILEKSYLLANRPEIKYDYCNIDFNEFSKFSRGFHIKKDIEVDFKTAFLENKNSHNFYFIEKLTPSHITNQKSPVAIASIQREKYISRLKDTNIWLKNVINFIVDNDKNGLIIIAADHGGFVGLNYSLECREKLTDRDLIYSIFTSKLAIRWPENAPQYDTKIKTPVNLFRILFSHLSENEKYLEHLQSNSSYLLINKGAPFGVYETINNQDKLVFKKLSDKIE